MPINPWIAVDATAPPSLRVRDLRRLWDEYLGAGRLDQVRRPIADSWHRSEIAGLTPRARERRLCSRIAVTSVSFGRRIRSRWRRR